MTLKLCTEETCRYGGFDSSSWSRDRCLPGPLESILWLRWRDNSPSTPMRSRILQFWWLRFCLCRTSVVTGSESKQYPANSGPQSLQFPYASAGKNVSTMLYGKSEQLLLNYYCNYTIYLWHTQSVWSETVGCDCPEIGCTHFSCLVGVQRLIWLYFPPLSLVLWMSCVAKKSLFRALLNDYVM